MISDSNVYSINQIMSYLTRPRSGVAALLSLGLHHSDTFLWLAKMDPAAFVKLYYETFDRNRSELASLYVRLFPIS